MKRRHAGFTLIELAIGLVIITLLIGGLAVPLTAQLQARRVLETQRTLEAARDALLGYAMTHRAAGTNRHLPCPDTDTPPDGRENRNAGNCVSNGGVLPWVDLGVAPQDAWGNRLTYAVLSQYSNSQTGFNQAAPILTDPLEIASSASLNNPDVADRVVFVVLSHGPNGRGARSIAGTALAPPTSPDELENTDGDRRFISRSPTRADSPSGEFDDLPIWVSHPQLIQRVCPSGSDCAPTGL